MFYPAIVTPDDGAFIVTFPDAPGCVTQVERVDEVMAMATEALAGWLDATLDAGDVVSPPRAKRRAPRGSRGILVPVVPTAIAVRVLLRRARAEQGMTLEDLAERIGISVQMVRRLERSGANPTQETLDRLVSAVNKAPVFGLVREDAGGAHASRGRSPRRKRP